MRTEKLDFATFALDARRFFDADDLVATVPITVIDALGAGTSYGPAAPELWRVTAHDGTPLLFALRTPPYALLLAAGAPIAATALGQGVAAEDDARERRRSVTGPERLVEAFARGYAPDGFDREDEKRTVFYRIDALAPPSAPVGRARRATSADQEALVDLFADFERAVGVPVPIGASAVARATSEARIFVWEVDGEIVSVAQRSSFTRTNARINLVYTPVSQRGHGFAGAAVAALVEDILRQRPAGCLFADAANATSNALYQRLGFVAVARHTTVDVVRR